MGSTDDRGTRVNGDRWRETRQVFQEAWTRAGADRAAFVEERCAGDPVLHASVTALLDAHDRARDDRLLRDVIGAVARDLFVRRRP